MQASMYLKKISGSSVWGSKLQRKNIRPGFMPKVSRTSIDFLVSILDAYLTATSPTTYPFYWKLVFIRSCMHSRESSSLSLPKNSIMISLGML